MIATAAAAAAAAVAVAAAAAAAAAATNNKIEFLALVVAPEVRSMTGMKLWLPRTEDESRTGHVSRHGPVTRRSRPGHKMLIAARSYARHAPATRPS